MTVRHMIAALGVLAPSLVASAQEVVVASLPWTTGQTTGYLAQLYLGAGGTDRWLCEDFSTEKTFHLSTLECIGWVNPLSTAGLVQDFVVQILDDYPPAGKVILESTPGAGFYSTNGTFVSKYVASFDGQTLPPGDYVAMWAAVLPSTAGIALVWHQPGPNAVGGGLPNNGFWWVPSTQTLIPLPLELGGGGNSGANFILKGEEATCYADCDGSGSLDFFDFLCFQNEFAGGCP